MGSSGRSKGTSSKSKARKQERIEEPKRRVRDLSPKDASAVKGGKGYLTIKQSDVNVST